ncbi:uncharacterized protein Z519_05861 [Cladophialophora bantiana CBS 173.52]|uniref:Major facilitator superfamily (MFS) profile domain-containing protein n=1 Tax=Cladophialophora bantiana (strain ATCC 10958 / CBS 173.52 / CDC B-1940 / NIH 8579) TaxID=1442370 RepID=A0A0D2ETK5_CLAB1|nr:uncharacterized protein Z519_05861 [Cladophialophora bantiana CBS 173.52]KIW93256.1 hypothetical protein Z519_05861 [Cladophialophora bantiana CBS 173.52]
MDRSSKDMDTTSIQKELAIEAELVHADVDGADVVHHKTKKEKRLVLKQDLSIVVLLAGCYWFAYLDRGALGNARIMGFQTDLGLSGKQFYNCLMMFYVGYLVFELPAALSLRLFHPNWAYGTAVIIFGILATSMTAVRSYAPIMVIRVLLGFAEAFVQTGFVFLSLWYRREEVTTRAAFYFLATPVAGATSGLIAYGVQRNLDGDLGKAAWEWFFLIEGILTIVWGILVICLLPKLPETVAKRGSVLFRDPQEHALILQRTAAARNTPDAKPRLFQVWWALKDAKTWLLAMAIAAASLDVAAFGAFLPTFIHQFGFSALDTQLYTIIPYAFATVSVPVVCILADRIDKRAIPFLICMAVSVIGFIIILATTNKTALVAGCCFIAAGCYPAIVVCATWLVNSHAGYTKRCTAWAVAQVFTQSYSIIATQVYDNSPRYFKGHAVLLGLNLLGALSAAISYFLMKRENKKRDQIAQDLISRGEQDPDNSKTFEELCDYHPQFRYKI